MNLEQTIASRLKAGEGGNECVLAFIGWIKGGRETEVPAEWIVAIESKTHTHTHVPSRDLI